MFVVGHSHSTEYLMSSISGHIGALPRPRPMQHALAPFAMRFTAMGGPNEVAIFAADREAAGRALHAAAHEVLRIEAKYSRYRNDSVVSRINAGAGELGAVECDAETLALLECADRLHSLGDGLFDVTSGVLRRAWNFASGQLPKPEDLEPLLPLVGWERVERTAEGVRLPTVGMQIDLGGIGKEYAADQAARVLQAAGIAHGFVNLGGDIRVIGPQPDGEPWPIGVQNPRARGEIIARVPVARGGLATSGDSEKFIEVDGTRYCHILNPRTGYPVVHWASVSVRAETALAAGALSTIAMLKERDAVAFLTLQNCSFLAIDTKGKLHSNAPATPETC